MELIQRGAGDAQILLSAIQQKKPKKKLISVNPERYRNISIVLDQYRIY